MIVESVIELVVVDLVDHVITVVRHDVVVEPVTPQNFIRQVRCSHLCKISQANNLCIIKALTEILSSKASENY